MEPTYDATVDGQEFQQADADLIGAVAGLADDRVLAEILRVAPYDGTTVYKAVLGYNFRAQGRVYTALTTNPAIVQSTGSANGSLNIWPFRAVVGSRNAPSSPPSPNPLATTSNALANWRDIRSGIFCGSSSINVTLPALTANSSGNPRWDLVYATVAVDSNLNSVSRRVKNPFSGALTVTAIPQYIQSPVSVAVVTGTPGTIPALPSLPADSAGNYNIALAYVRVATGFSSTSTILPQDIRATNGAGAAFTTGRGTGFRPASSNNDANNGGAAGANVFNVATGPFYYDPANTVGGRPNVFMPPEWVGHADVVLVELDLSTSSSASWSHTSGSLIDDSMDWRNRIFQVWVTSSATEDFCTNPTAAAVRMPFCYPSAPTPLTMEMSNSLGHDGILVAGASTVFQVTHTEQAALQSGSLVGAYVETSSGRLLLYVNGVSPQAKVFAWITAGPRMPNA